MVREGLIVVASGLPLWVGCWVCDDPGAADEVVDGTDAIGDAVGAADVLAVVGAAAIAAGSVAPGTSDVAGAG